MSVKVTGLDKALAALAAADQKAARKAVRDGTNDWTKVGLAAAKSNLRTLDAIDTGTLLKALGRKVKTYRRGQIAVGIVGVRKGGPAKRRLKAARSRYRAAVAASAKGKVPIPANYLHLLEFGTRPHAIGKGASLGRAAHRGRKAVARSQHGRMHPGARPKAFLRAMYYLTRRDARRLIEMRVKVALMALWK